MKKLMFLIALTAMPAVALADESTDSQAPPAPTTTQPAVTLSKFEAYQQRLAARRANALELRREYNAAKGPHVYRTATALYVRPFIAIEQGWVNQPPIPVVVRPVIGVRPVDPYGYYYGDRVIGRAANGYAFAVSRKR